MKSALFEPPEKIINLTDKTCDELLLDVLDNEQTLLNQQCQCPEEVEFGFERVEFSESGILMNPEVNPELLQALVVLPEVLQALQDFTGLYQEKLRAEITAQIRREEIIKIRTKFFDSIGNSINKVALCFHEVYEAGSDEEKTQAKDDGLKSLAAIFAAWQTYSSEKVF